MIDTAHMLARIALAAALGSVAGIERERLDWAAGLRDHMLVCTGSALFMLVSCYGFSEVVGASHVALDPSRVAAQVVSGIGFLGAGTILVRGEFIKGLTTAASLWVTAAVGLAAGGGLYLAAIATMILQVVILAGIKPLEQRFFPGRKPHELSARLKRGVGSVAEVEAAVSNAQGEIIHSAVRLTDEPGIDEVVIVFRRAKGQELVHLIESLRRMDGIIAVNYHRH